jgi:hypothetical protein
MSITIHASRFPGEFLRISCDGLKPLREDVAVLLLLFTGSGKFMVLSVKSRETKNPQIDRTALRSCRGPHN